VDEGVDRTTVVTVMILPLEVERNVDFVSEGVGVGLGGRVEEEEEVEEVVVVVEDVEEGGREVEVDEVEGDESKVDDGGDAELLTELLLVVEVSVGVDDVPDLR